MPTLALFPTWIHHGRLLSPTSDAKLLRELKREAHQIAEADKEGRKWCRSNYPGGYTSYASWSRLFEMSSTFATFEKRLDLKVQSYSRACAMDLKAGELEMVSLWVNVLERGGSHGLHLHPLSAVSGTVYLSATKKGGAFKVEDPRLSKMMAAPPRRGGRKDLPGGFYRIQPRTGDLILFESWLRHEVEPHFEASARISVSFNYNWR